MFWHRRVAIQQLEKTKHVSQTIQIFIHKHVPEPRFCNECLDIYLYLVGNLSFRGTTWFGVSIEAHGVWPNSASSPSATADSASASAATADSSSVHSLDSATAASS